MHVQKQKGSVPVVILFENMDETEQMADAIDALLNETDDDVITEEQRKMLNGVVSRLTDIHNGEC